MKPEDLLEEWESGETTGMRPKRVQSLRDELSDATGLPIPRQLSQIESWLDRFKGTVTRELRRAAGEYDEVEDPVEDGDGEGE